MTLSYALIKEIYEKIAPQTIRTPLVEASRLSLNLGVDLWLKLENLQHTNAFKARGALAKLLSLSDSERAAGVIACSAGNHAQAVAYHASRLNIPSVIVMPEGTPFNKVQRTADYGAQVVIHGATFDESAVHTDQLAKERGLTYVHPFDDPIVAAGQGSVAIEMLEQDPDLDVLVVPIGGGGLISGIAVAAKALKPSIQIIGAQAQHFDAVAARLEGREPTSSLSTLAEGIAVKHPSSANFAHIQAHVDRVETVSESQIEQAVFDLLSYEKLVAEGAAGAGLAVVRNLSAELEGKRVGLVLCGGNIDSRLLSTLIMRGMVREGRIARLTFEIADRPGQLADIARIIGEAGANVVEVIHQRMMQAIELKRAELEVVIEARDTAHVDEILAQLRGENFTVRLQSEI